MPDPRPAPVVTASTSWHWNCSTCARKTAIGRLPLRHAQYWAGGGSKISRRTIQGSMNWVRPPPRTTSAIGTVSPISAGAPRHHVEEPRPAAERRSATRPRSVAKAASARRDRNVVASSGTASEVRGGTVKTSGSMRTTTASTRCDFSLPVAQASSHSRPYTSSSPQAASAGPTVSTHASAIGASVGVAAALTSSHLSNPARCVAGRVAGWSRSGRPWLARMRSSIGSGRVGPGRWMTRPSGPRASPPPIVIVASSPETSRP